MLHLLIFIILSTITGISTAANQMSDDTVIELSTQPMSEIAKKACHIMNLEDPECKKIIQELFTKEMPTTTTKNENKKNEIIAKLSQAGKK